MATARREQQRTHAVDVATVSGSDGKKKHDWDGFIKTGVLKQHEPLSIPTTPLIQHYIDRIKASGGRFVLEDN